MPLSYNAPDASLERELHQVAIDAAAVSLAMKRLNAVPIEFPQGQLLDLCDALEGLSKGTAENCRPTLELARNVLPKIRREHFLLEDEPFEGVNGNSDVINFYRGMSLDQHLKTLLASVTTALDEYRSQVQERFDDEVRSDETALLSGLNVTSTVEVGTDNVLREVISAKNQLDHHGISKTERGDILRRRLQDSGNLALATRSQLRARTVIRRWYEGVAKAFQKMPDLIIAAGKSLRIGAEIAQYLVDWWHAFQADTLNSALKHVRSLGDTLENIGTRLKFARSHSVTLEESIRNPEIVRAEAVVEQMLVNGVTPPTDIANLVEIINLNKGNIDKITRIPKWKDIELAKN
jgi:hypothetical protein